MNQNGGHLLTSFLKRDRISCSLVETTPKGVIRELIALLEVSAGGFDAEAAYRAVLEREAAAPTLVAEGLAMPHARIRGLPAPLMALGLSVSGVVFDPARPPAHIIVLTLTPREDPNTYLRLVSAIASAMSDRQLRKHLAACQTAEEVCTILCGRQDSLPSYLCARHLMNPAPATLRETDTLADAIRVLVTQPAPEVPVVDEDGDVKGVVAEEDILRFSLPEHVLWMEDLSGILNFEPFVDVLKQDLDTKVADIMRETFAFLEPDAPAIQLARIFVREDVRQILVLEGRKLLGVVGQRSFITQIFWA